jgi:two-component system sensor histidine kinase VanS
LNIKKITTAFRNTIAFKVFGLTAAILLLFAIGTYLVIFTLLPPTYKNYKQNQLVQEIDSFIAKSATLSDKETDKEFEALRQKTNTLITVLDESNQMLSTYTLMGEPIVGLRVDPAFIKGPALTEATANVTEAKPNTTVKSYRTTTVAKEEPPLIRDITFKGKSALLLAYPTLQPIDEASKVLLLLAPYVALFILIASVVSSLWYTMLITRPIRRITASASRMAELQLDTRIPVHSSDEIGRLASSLNTMAINLKGSISDLKMANESLQLEMEREREIDIRRRELFAAVSHELKSPLTIMKGQLEGMLYKIGIYKDRDVYLDKTLEVAEEMETLISDILRVAKSDKLTLPSNDEHISLRVVVDTLLSKYEELGHQRGISLQSTVSDDSFIRTNRKLLETALNNVTHNAIIYTNYGEKVVIRVVDKVEDQRIEILNTGAKIDEAKIDRIFEPFYRLEQSRNRNTGGSGLGLYITQQLLQQLDISIKVKNTPEGVLFSIHLPINTSH